MKNQSNGMLLCDELRQTLHGNVLFNDEDDGYRILWIESGHNFNNNEESAKNVKIKDLGDEGSRLQFKPQRFDIIEDCDDQSFEYLIVDPRTGCSHHERKGTLRADEDSIGVVFEAYLHIDALLSEILYRRRKLMFKSIDVTSQNGGVMNIPDFFYNIVSFNSTTGRSATIVIAFVNPRSELSNSPVEENVCAGSKRNCQQQQQQQQQLQPASYAVFIEIDLIDQSYSEIEWVVHPTKRDSIFLRKWSNDLALLRRMKEMQIGPYCAGEDLVRQLNGANRSNIMCNEYWNDRDCFDEEKDFNTDVWKDFVKTILFDDNCMSSTLVQEISMGSLYGYCDILSNNAVISSKPLSQFKSPEYPVEVRYLIT